MQETHADIATKVPDLDWHFSFAFFKGGLCTKINTKWVWDFEEDLRLTFLHSHAVFFYFLLDLISINFTFTL